LSFVYCLTDIVCETAPSQMILQALLLEAEGSQLPLGEGSSVWYDSPTEKPAILDKDQYESLPNIVEIGGPMRVRREAFKVASQIYEFFGYPANRLPFSRGDTISFEATSEVSGIAATVSYLQGRLGARVLYGGPEHASGIYWSELYPLPDQKRRTIGASEEFIYEVASDEDALFKMLDDMDLENAVKDWKQDHKPLLTTNGLEFV
jgi:hypothetical protein